jgi:hypothetical protein
LRHEAVTSEVETVSQSQGRPISAATKKGFRSAFFDPLGPSGVVVACWRPAVSKAGVPHILDWTVSEVGSVRPPPILAFIAR